MGRHPKEPVVDETGEDVVKPSIVAVNSETVATQYRVAMFRGRAVLEVLEPYPHFEILHRERFNKIAYPILGGVTRSRMADVFSFICNTAEDLSENDHLVSFGMDAGNPGLPVVWDMRALKWLPKGRPAECIWRSPYSPPQELLLGEKLPRRRVEFVMQLAGGDEDLYDDMMQSMAPLIMDRKPDGVIWWVGDGANGKSTLMDAIYRIFPDQLSSINVKRLTDGRDTPSLNGMLGNIVKESSEGRVDDTEIYKSIGTHENFRVHKFHSQDDVEIRGNLHHIFSANTIPSFNDKGYSAKRRTFIIPFKERFESDPSFEEKTFTDQLFSDLIVEMGVYAQQIKKQGYRYKWSAKTLAAKAEYDAEASNAEEYARHIISEGVIAFNSFNPVRVDYENWCADNGYVPLGVGNMRRALLTLGFERYTIRTGDNDSMVNQYRLPGFDAKDLQQMGGGRVGLYTTLGFRPIEPEPEAPQTQSILGGEW